MRTIALLFLAVILPNISMADTPDYYIPIAADGEAFTWAHNTLEFSNANRDPAPQLNDGDPEDFVWLSHDVTGGPLAEDFPNTWQAVGVIWNEPQHFVKQVIYHHGPYDGLPESNGSFSGEGSFHLQISVDGTSWENVPISSIPAYTTYQGEENNGAEVNNALFTFDDVFPSIRGIRVLGLVRTSEQVGSFNATCRQIHVFEATSVQIVSQPVSQIQPVGGTAVFNVEATGEPPLTYQWYRNGSAIPGETNNTHSTPVLTIGDDGSLFHCMAFDAVDSLQSQQAMLTVNPASGGDLTLASNGQAHFYIYHGPTENPVVSHAAQELGFWLERISGVAFTITTNENDSPHLIVVGNNNPLVAALAGQVDFTTIEGDGFRLLSNDHRLFIVGSIDRGAMYGVYHFLDFYLGVRWYSPEFEVVPSLTTIAVPPMDDLQNPHYRYREIFSGDTDDGYFRQHNRLNGSRGETHRQFLFYEEGINDWSQDGAFGGHNFHDIIGPIYHSGGQIPAMSNGVRQQAAAYFTELVFDEGAGPWYGFSQEDNGWDPDEASLQFANAHGGALSAPILDMVTDIAQRVRETNPEAHLSTLAYQWSFDPPTGMSVPEYVLVETAPIAADFGYPYNHSRNADIDYEQWNQTAASLGIWDYIANFQNYLQPLPTLYPMCQNIQYLSQLSSMRAYFGEGAYNGVGAEFAELRAWVAARLLWDPTLNYHALINEFCQGYYGPAGTTISQYLGVLYESLLSSGDRISSKQRITSDYLNLDFILQADQMMAAADAAAAGDFSEHVHNVRLGVDMTILLREHVYAAEAEAQGLTWVHDPGRRARFDQYVAEAGIEYYAEDSSISDLMAALDINRINPPDPDFVPQGHQWIDYQDMDMSICCGANLTEDPLASDHGAVAKGSGGEWAISMSMDLLPSEGQWTLYGVVRADLVGGANPDGAAVHMGIWPGESQNVNVSSLTTGEYSVFEFPNMPISYETGKRLWFACGPESEMIYIDRVIAVNTASVSGENPIIVHRFSMQKNFPNPFNPSTTIRFSLPVGEDVSLEIFDVRGRKVSSIIDGEHLLPGWHSATWVGQDDSGRRMASGVYYCRLVAGTNTQTQKLVLLK